METSAAKWSPWSWYSGVLITCVTLSIGGFFYGAYHDPSSDGGRGGAIAVAFAFASLFVRSDHPQRSFRFYANQLPKAVAEVEVARNELTGKSPRISSTPDDGAMDVPQTVNGILGVINAQGTDQRHQNICIAAASIIGTLSWGFGDKIACQICRVWLHLPCVKC